MSFKPRIIFRVDGNETVGLGHLSRCINLARGLEELGAAAAFATRFPAFLRSIEGGDAFETIKIPSAADLRREMEILKSHFHARGGRGVVFDIGNLDRETVRAAREFCDVICTVDDRGAARRETDFIFNTVIDGLDSGMRRVGGARLYAGGRYLFLPPEIGEIAKQRKPPGGRVGEILVAMGGSDPRGLTPKIIESALEADAEVRIKVVGGAGFSRENVRNIKSAADGRVELLISPRSILPHLAGADIGVTSGGVTLTEMAAVGMPAVALSQGRFAHTAAGEFEKKGCCILLGRGARVSKKNLRNCLACLIEDKILRAKMSRAGRRAVDSGGVYRVGKLIFEEMKNKSTVFSLQSTGKNQLR